MLNEQISRASEDEKFSDDAVHSANTDGPEAVDPAPAYDESIIEELGALIDDAGLYATAEIAFQKTRAKLAGRNFGAAVLLVSVALVLFHIALIAMAVGFVIALAPLVTIWGAIAIVVGAMLIGVAVLLHFAIKRGKLLRQIFASKPAEGDRI